MRTRRDGQYFMLLSSSEIYVNGNENETEKFDTKTDNFGWVGVGLCPFSFPLYFRFTPSRRFYVCLLYTSDAADE